MECSNEFSACLGVQHLNIAVVSVLYHICSVKNSFDLRWLNVMCVCTLLYVNDTEPSKGWFLTYLNCLLDNLTLKCSLLPQQQTKVNRLASWSGGSGAVMKSWHHLLLVAWVYVIIKFHSFYILTSFNVIAHNYSFLSSVHLVNKLSSQLLATSAQRSLTWKDPHPPSLLACFLVLSPAIWMGAICWT